MIAELLTVPNSPEEWDRWSWHHRSDHEEIIAAIQQQKKIQLFEYQVEPISWGEFDHWLEANEQMHYDMNNVLKVQGQDLEDLNVKDQGALANWIYFHWLEHQTARQALGI